MLIPKLNVNRSVLEKLERADFISAIARGAEKGMIETAGHIQKTKLSGQLLQPRTGHLRRAMTYRIARASDKVKASIGNYAPYARIQEEGGTIRPKRARYLTIPTDYAKTAAGVVRGGARSFRNTFVRKTKSGGLAIFQKQEDGIVPIFWLVDKVEINGKHYIRKGLNDKLGSIMDRIRREVLKVAE